MIDVATLPYSAHPDNDLSRAGEACSWCDRTDDVETYRNEPRCGTCREHETVIDAARRFIGMYGLRPLGGSVTSEDEDELRHRTDARAARAALDSTRSAKAAKPRKPRATTQRPATQRATSRVSKTDTVDVAALGIRVTALLEQLATIDAEITDLDGSTGLPARARMSDLERQRTTVMTTLAALEKARRNAR
ncbi:hypothetical protein GCM10007304_19710 [Rhodococcoides trifolii]|uniref:Uncharacterized protein n=2 Tax=Rhodococcoides trifolii TaxID=908250 RepID=A0A917CZ73_9NOCA|nr:hypothetical protein GCM10007304_19710 [Rhodococcus trifolii]